MLHEGPAASEHPHRTILDVMEEGVLVRSGKGDILSVNPSALRLLGLDEDQIAGRRALPDGWSACFEDGRAALPLPALAAGPASRRAVRLERPQGEVAWLSWSTTPLPDPSGCPDAYLTTLVDITAEREAAQQALQRARERDLARRINEIELVVSLDGRVREANDRAVDAYGYTREELLGLNVVDLRLDDRMFVTGQMAEAAREGIRFEPLHRRKDGSTFPVGVSSRAFEVDGEALLHSIIRDLTDTKRIERERHLLGELVRSAMDGILVTDAELKITQYGGAAEAIYGWTREEALGRDLRATFRLEYPDGDRDEVLARMAAGQQIRARVRALRKDGTRALLDLAATPLRDAQDRLTGWLSVTRDIGPQMAVEAALRKREAELTEEAGRSAQMVVELQDALEHVRTLKGLLPICMHCHRIRNDEGYWNRLEQYIEARTEAAFSHSLCPECLDRYHAGED